MANGHGGARPGAGRPKKALADKILEGTTAKHRPKVLNFEGAALPSEPPVWFPYYGSKTSGDPDAPEIFKETTEWLEKTGCGHLVNPNFITDYAIVKASFYEASRIVAKLGLFYVVEKGSDKIMMANPMIDVVHKYFKMSNEAWNKIWSIVAQNSESYFGDDPNMDITSYLLNNKPAR